MPKVRVEGRDEVYRFPDDTPREEIARQLRNYLFPRRPQQSTADTVAQTGSVAGLFAPGSGLADAIGVYPTGEGTNYPSMMENILSGNFADAGFQALGVVGDISYATAPITGPIGVGIGMAAKAPRAARAGTRAASRLYHGTGTDEAAGILSSGIRESPPQPYRMGQKLGGLYLTPRMSYAESYAARRGPGAGRESFASHTRPADQQAIVGYDLSPDARVVIEGSPEYQSAVTSNTNGGRTDWEGVRSTLRERGFHALQSASDMEVVVFDRSVLSPPTVYGRNDGGGWEPRAANAGTRVVGRFQMPQAGTTRGSVDAPLYRFISGDTLDEPYGMHWTHSREEVEKMAADEAGYIITARHPGYDNIMDWENPADLPLMEREIGGYEYRDSVFPEVPVRPGTRMDALQIEHIDSDGNVTLIPPPKK